jgi:translin
MATGIDALGSAIQERLDLKNGRRETIMGLSRLLVQHAARAIRAVHRAEWTEAGETLVEARDLVKRMHHAAEGHPDLQAAGYMLDAQKEFAEAHLTLALCRGEPLPGPQDLSVDDASWLNGLGEAAGELRRGALDRIRAGDVAAAEELLGRMQEIYTLLTAFDYPAVITRNLKQTTDMVRGVTERTRGDLTVAAGQEQLKAALSDFAARVAPRPERR